MDPDAADLYLAAGGGSRLVDMRVAHLVREELERLRLRSYRVTTAGCASPAEERERPPARLGDGLLVEREGPSRIRTATRRA